MRRIHSILLCTLMLHQFAGCNDVEKPQSGASSGEAVKSTATPETDRAQPPTASPDPASIRRLSDPTRGKVTETIEAGAYTYVLLATGQGEIWAAATRFSVAVGDEVEIAGLSTMRNFRSPTLGRVFEEIQFVGRATVIGGNATVESPKAPTATGDLPPGHPPLGGQAAAHRTPAQLSGSKTGRIEKLADGVTVAELFANKPELTGKVVKFRGRVVKASRMILGSNWLHIQDGTGEPGSNDITVTSKTDFAAVGSIVVIEGTLGVDKDFGAGYSYDVIVEDASVVPEPTEKGATGPGSGKPGQPDTS